MSISRLQHWWASWRNAASSAIDLGNGRQIGFEDVLESHFRRLAAVQPNTRDVEVRVAPNLNAAIRVIAPELAPLTRIAEELAVAFPNVQPTPRFRSDLQRALQMAHRQQNAQRVLGTRPAPVHSETHDRSGAVTWSLALAAVGLLLGLGVAWWWGRRRRPAQE